MSEQGTPTEGTPAVAGPEGTPGAAEQATEQAEIDWQDRYQHLQPEYTRVTQENAQLREVQELYELLLSSDDPDTRREVATQLGYMLDDEDQDQSNEDSEDPLAAYDERLGRLEQSHAEREQEQADAAYAAQVREVVDEQLDALELDADDQDWVLAYAINALPITEDGLPDIRQAYEVFMQRETERQRNWARSKRAPHISPHGQSGTEAPNLDNRQERQDFVVRRLQENEAGY
jgi:hypothetical protein